MPCRTCYFAPGRFEEKDELHQVDMNKRINCTRMIWRKKLTEPGWYEEKDELHQDDVKKKINWGRMVWRKGWIAPGLYEENYEFILFLKFYNLYKSFFYDQAPAVSSSSSQHYRYPRWHTFCVRCTIYYSCYLFTVYNVQYRYRYRYRYVRLPITIL